MKNARLIKKGKAKDVYKNEDGDVVFVFTDRVTAFDGRKKSEYEKKGEICAKLSGFWFKKLHDAGIKTHFKRYVPPNKLVAIEVNILPVEVIARDYLYGSLWRRYKRGEIEIGNDFVPHMGREKCEGMPLIKTFLEFTTKFEPVDRPISEEEIMERGWMVKKEIEYIKEESTRVGDIMRTYLSQRGIILADFKLEFGINEGEIILADEVGTPDVCRFWDMEAYEKREEIISWDKDVFRKDKGHLSVVYAEVYRRICGVSLC